MIVAGLLLALAQTEPVTRGHSHNDYLRSRPLEDAWDAGLCSVEADVFLVDGRLLVAHDRASLNPARTFEQMYLAPIERRLARGNGWIYPGFRETFWVLVDVKADGPAAYSQFKTELGRHPRLAWFSERPSVRFVISGSRPIEEIVADKGHFAGLDGRWNDLEQGYSPQVMPWVSESWLTHFTWLGVGLFPERAKLNSMTKQAHERGYKIRFWGAPDDGAIWKEQWNAGVDWLNTDQPKALRDYLLQVRG